MQKLLYVKTSTYTCLVGWSYKAQAAWCNAEIANPRPKASGAKAIRAQQMQAHEPKQVGSYDNGLALRVSIPGAEFLRRSYVVNL